MNISTLQKQGVLIVRVEGELDMKSADQFRQAVDDALDSSSVKHVLLSLKGVTFIDSSGLGVILGRYKKICALGGKLAASNVKPQVVKVLEFSGMLKIIKLFGTETEALERI